MKKRLYLKKWLEKTLMAIGMLNSVAMAGMVDNLECLTSMLTIPLIIIVIISIILMKYGRLGN